MSIIAIVGNFLVREYSLTTYQSFDGLIAIKQSGILKTERKDLINKNDFQNTNNFLYSDNQSLFKNVLE